jgi:hypothetical protein
MSLKAETSRRNGAKSNGPVTEAGKAISARNSLKHGLNSSRVVLPHESQEEFDRLEASFVNRFKPYDEVEHELVHEMVSVRWRLRRIEAMEAALFNKALQKHREAFGPEADPIDIQDAAYAEVADSKSLRMLSRHQAQLRRSYEKAWRELELIQENRSAEAEEDFQNEPTAPFTDRIVHPGAAKHTYFRSSSEVVASAIAAGVLELQNLPKDYAEMR